MTRTCCGSYWAVRPACVEITVHVVTGYAPRPVLTWPSIWWCRCPLSVRVPLDPRQADRAGIHVATKIRLQSTGRNRDPKTSQDTNMSNIRCSKPANPQCRGERRDTRIGRVATVEDAERRRVLLFLNPLTFQNLIIDYQYLNGHDEICEA